MKITGPIVTLAAGAALAAGLFATNLAFAGRNGPPPSAAVATKAAASTVTASTPSSVVSSLAPKPTAPTLSAAPTAAGMATYAGSVNGGGPLAVAVKGDAAVAYLCDGRTEAWLWGVADADGVSLKNPAGATLVAAGVGGRLVGNIVVKGRKWSFSLPAVTKPSGVYRSTAQIRGAKVVSGWVVLPDGRQVGMSTGQDGVSTPAPALDLQSGQAVIRGAVVTATPATPGEPHV